MEIVVDLVEREGRLEGTVRRATSDEANPFSGRLELLARLEELAEEPTGQRLLPGDQPGQH
ncbi:hypothetical protein GCM10009836_63480 [Pseudonocardia ailaonensis]|uniref:Uncharacterized protein n=1 Tax=Pseudonocardia ailaonensis TaxID=367279 RepID=A0ABN2NQ10_9PSEU